MVGVSKRVSYGDIDFEEIALKLFCDEGSNISDLESISEDVYIKSEQKFAQFFKPKCNNCI